MSEERGQCPVCGSKRLTPRTSYASFDNHARFKGLGRGIFNADMTVGPTQARICLGCGHMLLFVGAEKLERLRELFPND
jgi:hypothetical protein